MKKLRLLFLSILLSFAVIAFSLDVKADSLPTPTHTISGDYDAARDYYTSTLEITLGFSSSVSGVQIQYQLFEGIPPSEWTTYNKPIPIQRKGNYRLRYRSFSGGQFGTEQALNIRVDIPIIENYPNVIRNNEIINHKNTGNPIILPEYVERENEIRGVWVSTVSNIDLKAHINDTQYKNQIIEILNNVQRLNMNTVFFQVRSMNDAMYPSELAPFSKYIKGGQGIGLDWDILRFTIDEAHKRGLELHAWLNPYRVANFSSPTTKEEMLLTLHEDNFAKQNPELVLKSSDNSKPSFILDPGRPEVRDYLNDVIDELLNNYPDVDGIHFDDYFYVGTNEDSLTYANYNPNGIASLADWRRENVNMMIQSVNNLVKSFNSTNNKHVKFGVSPTGAWANKSTHPEGSNTTAYQSYSTLYADTRKWVKEEWLDYITPQIYWDFNNVAAPFAVLVDWWVDVVRDVDVELIIGLGFYRYNDDNPWVDENIYVELLRYINQYEEVSGHTTFTYNTFTGAKPQITSTLERLENYYWTQPVGFTWDSDVSVIPYDDAEMAQLRQDFKDVITSIANYITRNDVKVDTNLTFEEMPIGEYFVSKEALDNMDLAVREANNIVDNRFQKQIILDAKQALEDAFNEFKDEVYEGDFDPNRGSAAQILEDARNVLLTRRNLIKDSEGKQAHELPKGQYFADIEILNEVDDILLEALNIIEDENSKSSDINEVYQRLKNIEAIFNTSYFQGTKTENGEIIVTFVNGENTKTVTLTESGVVSKPNDPVKEGYIFKGWYKDGILFDFNTVITESITLEAQYEEVTSNEVIEDLEVAFTEFKNRVSGIKTSSNTNKEELRKNYKYVTPEKMQELKGLIVEIEELLDEEDVSIEEAIALLNALTDANEELDEIIIIGELETNYKGTTLLLGSIMASIAIIGAVTILVLVKKKK